MPLKKVTELFAPTVTVLICAPAGLRLTAHGIRLSKKQAEELAAGVARLYESWQSTALGNHSHAN